MIEDQPSAAVSPTPETVTPQPPAIQPASVEATGTDTGPTPVYLRDDKPNAPNGVKLNDLLTTSLYTGAATYSYDLQVPPGTNGLQPSLSIFYSSQKTQDIPGILGSGWDLSQYYIQRDTNHTQDILSDDNFRLVMGSSSYDLVFVPQENRFHTKTESYLFVENKSAGTNRLGSYWQVRDNEGTSYRFGFNPASEQVSNQGNFTWRWYLDTSTDTYGNSIYYGYNPNPFPNENGTVYPANITYDNDQLRLIKFEYETQDRPDLWITYTNGNQVINSRRLSIVSEYVNGQLVRKYTVQYQTPASSARSFLSSIQVIGNDGVSTLPPTTFEYNALTPGWTFNTTWIPPVCLANSTTGYDQGVLFSDVNGDGLIDILQGIANSSGCFRNAWMNNGTGWRINNSWAPPVCFAYNFNNTYHDLGERLADINGDGLTDIVQSNSSTFTNCIISQSHAWLNNGSGWTQNDSWKPPACIIGPNYEDYGTNFIDVNGDGKADIIQGLGSGLTVNYGYGWLNNGHGWDMHYEWKPPASLTEPGTRIGDINGDGLPDIIYGRYDIPYGLTSRAWLNNGTGWQNTPAYAPPIWFVSYDGATPAYTDGRVEDLNGDGLPDLVRAEDGSAWAYQNTGKGWLQNNSLVSPVHFRGGAPYGFRLIDATGNGISSIVEKYGPDVACSTAGAYISNATKPFLLKEIHNEYGGITRISYRPSIEFTSRENASNRIPYNTWIVSNITRDDGLSVNKGLGTNGTTRYEYASGSYDRPSKEFRGFGYAKEIQPDGAYSAHYFLQDEGRQGQEYLTEAYDANGSIYQRHSSNWNDQKQNGYHVIQLGNETQEDYDGAAGAPRTTSSNYAYDAFGNPVFKASLGDVLASGDERYEYTEYAPNTAAWILGKPSHYQLFGSDNATKFRESRTSYDGQSYGVAPTKGDPTRLEKWINSDPSPTFASVFYGYDGYGNKVNETDANGHTTTYTYGLRDTTYTFPDRQINALGQQKNFWTDLGTGNPLAVSDANGFMTNDTYDAFGRVLAEIQPYDNAAFPTKTYEYERDGRAPESVTVHQRETAGQPQTYDTTTFYDGLGRAHKTWKESENGMPITVFLFYDGNGRLIRQTLPDYANLTLETVNAWQKWSRTQNANNLHYYYWEAQNGSIRDMIQDCTDAPIGSLECWRVANYKEINPHGYLTKFPQDNTLFWEAGKMTRYSETPFLVSPVLGYTLPFDGNYTISGTINVNNGPGADGINLTLTLNQTGICSYDMAPGAQIQIQCTVNGHRGQEIRIFMDPKVNDVYDFGYLVNLTFSTNRESYPAITTNFSYDALDRLVKAQFPDNSAKSLAYNRWNTTATDENGHQILQEKDAYGQVTAVHEFAPADQVTRYDYDPAGGLVRITDALGNTFNTTYDTLGRKTKQQDPDLGTWTYTYDQVGNLLFQTDARGKTTQYVYDALNRPIQKQAGTLSFIGYTYDAQTKGALSSVQGIGWSDSFAYDQRLRTIGENKTLNGRTYRLIFTYDAMDRLTNKTVPDGEAISFAYTPQNQLDSIPGVVTSITHDANGKDLQRTYANGLQTIYFYNPLSLRLTGIQTGFLQNLAYAYDAVGNVLTINDTAHGRLTQNAYDALDRLTLTQISAFGRTLTFMYTYNAIGNLLQVARNGKSNSYVYAAKPVHAPSKATPSTQTGAWFNESYKYRRAFSLSSPTTLTGYQTALDISSVIPLSDLLPDASDLLTTYYDPQAGKELQIPAWLKDNTLWIRAPSTNGIYYLYYSSDSPNAFDGKQVFELFDDFHESTLNTSVWNASYTGTGQGTASIENGSLKLNQTDGMEKLSSTSPFGKGYALTLAGDSNYSWTGGYASHDFDANTLASGAYTEAETLSTYGRAGTVVGFWHDWSGTQGNNNIYYQMTYDDSTWNNLTYSPGADQWYDPIDPQTRLKRIPVANAIEFAPGHGGGTNYPHPALAWKAPINTTGRVQGTAKCAGTPFCDGGNGLNITVTVNNQRKGSVYVYGSQSFPLDIDAGALSPQDILRIIVDSDGGSSYDWGNFTNLTVYTPYLQATIKENGSLNSTYLQTTPESMQPITISRGTDKATFQANQTKASILTQSPNPLPAVIATYSNGGTTELTVHYAFVRKYADTEPAASFGILETNPNNITVHANLMRAALPPQLENTTMKATNEPRPTPSPTISPAPSPTETPTLQPVFNETNSTPTSTPSATPTPTPELMPSQTPTPMPTVTPTPSETPTETPTPQPVPTITPTNTPEPTPTEPPANDTPFNATLNVSNDTIVSTFETAIAMPSARFPIR